MRIRKNLSPVVLTKPRTILTPDEFKGFLKGNAITYAFRAGRKAGESAEKDKTKFLVYSNWLHNYQDKGTIK